MRLLIILVFSVFYSVDISAQSFYFGPKAGITLGVQQWNSLERDPLLSFHGAAYIESYDPDDRGSLYAQLGYHTRGSGIRVIEFFGSSASNRSFQFNNVALQLGARKRFSRSGSNTYFYHVGVRAEYTVSTNLEQYEEINIRNSSLFYPINQFVNKFNYGLSFGGGIEFGSNEFSTPFFEVTISPDVSLETLEISP